MLDDFKAWLAQPFSADMSARHWFYFIGLLIAINVAWAVILSTFRRQMEA